MLTREQKGQLCDVTVAVLLEMRAAYLASGGSPLKHWDQIQDRLRSAARQTSTSSEWATALMRSLGLSSPSVSLASSVDRLYEAVDGHGLADQWLDMLERDFGLLMSIARLESEERKAKRLAATADGGRES